MALPELKDFVLVGGTNLSLRLGHRLSIDLDLFTPNDFDTEWMFNFLLSHFPDAIFVSRSEHMLFMYINNVKIDMVRLPYPYVQPIEYQEGIRLASLPDIAAMKLSAVSRRGVKKDFWDIAEMLHYYTVAEMIGFYKLKYSSHDIFHLIRSLVYFEDAELQKDPAPLKKVTWKQVKKKMQTVVRQYIKENT
jgi:predicted nucleotidyltransferase component of viral defense system